MKFLKEVIWQCFFQFSIAISKIVDENPEANIDKGLQKIASKSIKSLHCLELMNPKRSEEIRRKELSEKLIKVRDEREEKANAIEEKPQDTEATEDQKQIEGSKDESLSEKKEDSPTEEVQKEEQP